MNEDVAAPIVQRAEAAEVVRRLSHDPRAEVLAWEMTPISHIGIIDTTGGLHRVRGDARANGAVIEWTCVLKVVARSALAECVAPGSWCYLAAGAGLL